VVIRLERLAAECALQRDVVAAALGQLTTHGLLRQVAADGDRLTYELTVPTQEDR
jgi:hypothetical protein